MMTVDEKEQLIKEIVTILETRINTNSTNIDHNTSTAESKPVEILTLKECVEVIKGVSDMPIWEKYTLTIEEASKYFRIGETKLRKFAEENLASGWVLMNGNRLQIKRKQFEKIIDSLDVI